MGKEKLDWDKIRVFRTVAGLGSMNAAAAELGESAPTIGRKMDALERMLRTEIFRRTTRGVELTDAGKIMLRHVHAMADAAEAIYSEVSGRDQPTEGKVSLSTGDGLAGHWLGPRLATFHRENPKIELHLRVTDEPVSLIEGGIDLSIQFTEPVQQDIIRRRLGVLHYMFFATQEYLEAYGTPGSIFELFDHRCIIHTGYVNQIENWAPKTAQLKELFEFSLITNSSTVMCEVCNGGGGIALLPSYVQQTNSNLVPLDIAEVAPIQFWLAFTERVRRSERHQIVMDWLRKIFSTEHSPWFRETFIHPNSTDDAELDHLQSLIQSPADCQ